MGRGVMTKPQIIANNCILINIIFMGLDTAFKNLTVGFRLFRILLMKITLICRLLIPFLTNSNWRRSDSGIAQPRYYNSWADVKAGFTLLKLLWVNDLSDHFKHDQAFNRKYFAGDFDAIVKAYFKTENTAFESVNVEKCWRNSYWNPANQGKMEAYKKSDILFADSMVNVHNIFMVKKVAKDSATHRKVADFFEGILEKNRISFIEAEEGKSIIDSLIEQNNLYYVDYPALRKMEDSASLRNTVGGRKYQNNMLTSTNKPIQGYIQIPFAIFSEVTGYVEKDKKDFICLAAVFNDTFYKQKDEVNEKEDIYHTFVEDQIDRDRWEMAKAHMSSTHFNDFTIRVHLGLLHYATSLYTTGFYNVSRTHKNLNWLKTQFIDVFSSGLLQVNQMANVTLVDEKSPIAQRIFYLNRLQSAAIIQESNQKFNIMTFDPEHLGEDSFEGDSLKISKAYYKKVETYIDYLFEKHKASWAGKTERIGTLLFNQLQDSRGKFDSLPVEVTQDEDCSSLKKIMTNLAFSWIVFHGQTFSLVSVSSNFYFVPSMMSKPLSALESREITSEDKIQWLPPIDLIKSYEMLAKSVCFRYDQLSVISAWKNLKIDDDLWRRVGAEKEKKEDQDVKSYLDFWNDITLDLMNKNCQRSNKGLFYMHWLMPHELPISLNI